MISDQPSVLSHFSFFFLFSLQALRNSNYDAEPMLKSCGVSISKDLTQIEGRVLSAPRVFMFNLMLICLMLIDYLFCLSI